MMYTGAVREKNNWIHEAEPALNATSTFVSRTVLIADIVDWRGFLANSEENSADNTLVTFRRVFAEFANEKGLEIIKTPGDSIWFLFGKQQHAQAVQAGIAIHEEVQSRLNELGIKVSVGAATGEIMFSAEGLIIQPTIARAICLAGLAQAGGIFVCPTTWENVSLDGLVSSYGSVTVSNCESTFIPNFEDPLSYFEIVWSGKTCGVKPHRLEYDRGRRQGEIQFIWE